MNRKKTLKRITYLTFAVLVAAMMAATVLEKVHGTESALRWVYHNPVFIVLWGVVAVAGMWLLLTRVDARRQPCSVLLHVALVLILAGALVTHLWGEGGMIHLREGEPTAAFELDDESPATLPFSIRLEKFAIEYDPESNTPSDYRSDITFLPEDRAETISMNHIAKYRGYRFYQADYDEDGQGSILAVSRDPVGVAITYTGYLLLLVSMIGYFFQKDTLYRSARQAIRRRRPAGRKRHVFPVVLAVAGCALLLLWWLDAFPKGPLMPVLRSPLLFLHMIPIMVSYALFALLALLGVAGLVVKEGASERLHNVGLVILYPAVFLLTFGTFLGAVWANISWGNYWAWDPKETWALVTLLVYSLPLHGRVLPAFDKPRFFHLFMIIGILCVLVTYFGVNMLLGGMHSYA